MNEDNAPHTVTSRQEGIFDSSLINPASSWVLNSAEIAPAEYEYYCTLHPFMTATLVISSGTARKPELVKCHCKPRSNYE